MQTPEMIFFDIGHTLTYSPEKCRENGFAALWEHRERANCTYDELLRRAEKIFDEADVVADSFDYEIPFRLSLNLLLDSAGVTMKIPPFWQEKIFLKAARPAAAMPGAVRMIDFLRQRQIRRAVITNNRFSGSVLLSLLEEVFGRGAFEFVVSSADYLVRKPDKRLFEAALNRAGVSPEHSWHCGDVANGDVMGAHYAGISPVLYETDEVDNPFLRFNKGFAADFPFEKINRWEELCKLIDGLTK